MINIIDFNKSILKAIGLEDAKVMRLQIVLEPESYPIVFAKILIDNSEVITKVFEAVQWKEQND